MSDTPQLKPVDTLIDLATKIKTLHAEVIGAGRDIVLKGIEAGVALIDAKRQLGHGKFLPWLKQNCKVSERRAQDYMKLATNRLKIEAAMKSAPAADFSLKWALRVIDDGGDGGNEDAGSLGKYEKAQVSLIKKLRQLEPDDIEEAAQRTIAELQKVVATVKPGTRAAA
jgi:hypothetical protein